MSLIAHYPLNGDTKDYSGNDFHLTNPNNISIDANGKIGKCYSASSGTGFLTTSPKTFKFADNVSMFCWILVTDLSAVDYAIGVVTNHNHADNSGMGITLKKITDTSFKISCNTGYTNETRTYNTIFGNAILNTNTWNHIGFSYDSKTNNITFFANGTLDKVNNLGSNVMKFVQNPFEVFSWSVTNRYASYIPGQKINDVRIFDHSLTNREVRNIFNSQILHYTFNVPIQPFNNLAYKAIFKTYNNYDQNMVLTKLDEQFEGCDIYRMKFTPTTEQGLTSVRTLLKNQGVGCARPIFKANTKYCFWTLFRCITHPDTVVGGVASNIGGMTEISPHYYKNDWFRVGQFRDGSDIAEKTGSVYTSFKCPSLTLNEAIIIDFCCPCLVEGSDYIIENASYNSFSENIVYDESGFNNHSLPMLVENSPKWTSDGYSFGLNKFIRCPQSTKITDSVTVSLWAYKNNWQETPYERLISCTEGGGWALGINDTAGKISFLIFTNQYYGSHIETSALSPGWHNIVGKYDGRFVCVYLDGVLIQKQDTLQSRLITYCQTNTLVIGAETNTTLIPDSGFFNGKIQDVRIFATALQDDEILRLYKTRATIDNKNNISCRKLCENFDHNLLKNGMLEYKNSTNWSANNYSENDGGCLEISGVLGLFSNELIPVNPKDTYQIDCLIKSLNSAKLSSYFVCIHPFDEYGNPITPQNINIGANTKTTLAKNLVAGDTTATLTSSTNWVTTSSHLGIFNMPEYSNWERCSAITPIVTAINGNVITLGSAWAGATIPSETNVANTLRSRTYIYPFSGNIPCEWTQISGKISGEGLDNTLNFRPSTRYVQIGFLANYAQDATVSSRIKNIVFRNLTNPQQTYSMNTKLFADKNGQLSASYFNEIGMPIRYIKDSLAGSSINTSNHWVEIAAFDNLGVNRAFGAGQVVSGSHGVYPADSYGGKQVLTNGKTESGVYIYGGDYVQVDLGKLINIDKLKIWHFWGDGRTYHGNVTQVSADGVNWVTVFDSTINGEYIETSSGHEIVIYPQKVAITKAKQVFGKTFNED